MKCDQIELLFPAYVEGDLSASETARVEDHVRSCPVCDESLAEYRKLEGLLLERRESRPPAALTARRVVRRLGLVRRRRPAGVLAVIPRMVAALSGLPGIISGSLIGAGILLLFVGDAARSSVSQFGAEFLKRMPVAVDQLLLAIDRLTRSLDTSTGGQEWVPLAGYLGVFLVVASMGSWMVLRFVRE
ncbi:MAG: zf-HC2 domain-containing protein [Candidatus Krumholzibacteria bacterium]